MASGMEIATAWVRLVPSFEGAQAAISKGMDPIAREEGKKSGKVFSGAMAGAIAGIVAPVAAAALRTVKNLVGEMAAQVDSTKKFRSTLEFAGIDDSHIKKLTKTTQKYADETIYNLSEIRKVTAQLASNGVKDYDKLAQAGGNLNAISGGNAETFKTVGLVLTQTSGLGKLTAENWNQLSEAIPGASGRIQDALLKNGAFTGNFREAMSKGQITSEEFNAALLELGTEPIAVAAAKSTETFEGALGNLQANIVSVGANLLEKFQPAITGMATKIGDAVQKIIPAIDWIQDNFHWIAPVSVALLTAAVGFQALSIAANIAAAGGLAKWLMTTKIATGIQAAFNLVLSANPIALVVIAIAALVAALVYFFTQTELGREIWKKFTDFVKTAWENTVKAIKSFWENVLQPVFKAIGDVFVWLWTFIIKPIVDMVINYFRLWGAIVGWLYKNIVKPIFEAIGQVFNWLWTNVIKPVVDWIKERLDVLGRGFKILYDNFIKPAFDNISAKVTDVWNWIDRHVFTPFKTGVDLIGKAFENTAKAIGTAWNGIKRAAAIPVNFVLETVWNNGIRAFWNGMVGTLGLNDMKLPAAKLIKFAAGGVLPGYTPGRDVHEFYSPTGGRLALSGGEAIMRPEFTKLVGGAAGVNRLNKLARGGSLGFANGGVFGGLADFGGDVLDKIASGAKIAWDFVTDPVGAIKKHVVDGIISPLLGGAGSSVFGRMAGALPGKLMGKLGSMFKGVGGYGKSGMGWEAMWNIVKNAVPGAIMTSGYRNPARNASVGGAKGSLHMQGRAIDLAPASMATFNAVSKLFPNATELIYTPAGSRQLLRGKPFNGWSAAVKRQHYSHVHLGMKDGGVWPGLMNGGTITKSGYTVVGENGPEVLNLPQGAQVTPDYDKMSMMRGGVTFNNYASLGQTPSQALTQFANRAKGL